MKTINKLLIANRGEIALRIQRACKKLGIKTVSIASEADKNSMFARQAEELIIIGKPAPQDSYLNIEKIIKAAKESGADAVHPGYGFLSESYLFAERLAQEGITLVGPDVEAIRIMASKTEARASVSKYNVPFAPGSEGGLSDQQLLAKAKEIGCPVIIKASYGGGGRGMRIINDLSEMEQSLLRARAEALKNFGNADVYIEKYILHPRHVEVQVFGDKHGNIVHFGTRDCSTQRRHQKLIEEAPAPFIEEGLRERIHQAAILAAKSVNYVNAGTIEFLLSGSEFYFLEMNTRIQVEHPVSEEVTGWDLVELQLRIAMGEKLPSQKEIKVRGHAIEFRIYAEDPRNNFVPAIGKITKLNRPKADYLREDYGFEEGDEVTPYYDAMISKLIVKGETRNQALERSKLALKQYEVGGLKTTIDFHRWLLMFSPFKDAPIDIGFIEREFSEQAKTLGADSQFAALDLVEASDILDPLHRVGPAGTEIVELIRHSSKNFETEYTIELLHRKDGVFVARPKSFDGRYAQNRFCRSSNGLNCAIESLINEVLEKHSPNEIFINNE